MLISFSASAVECVLGDRYEKDELEATLSREIGGKIKISERFNILNLAPQNRLVDQRFYKWDIKRNGKKYSGCQILLHLGAENDFSISECTPELETDRTWDDGLTHTFVSLDHLFKCEDLPKEKKPAKPRKRATVERPL